MVYIKYSRGVKVNDSSSNYIDIVCMYVAQVEDSGTEHAGYQRPSAEHPPENNSAVSQETQHNRHIQVTLNC